MSAETLLPPPDFPADPSLSYNPQRTWNRDWSNSDLRVPDVQQAGELPTLPLPAGPSPRTAQADACEYHFRTRVGKGGFGEVWEAEQTSLARLIAIKQIRLDLWDQVSGSAGEEQLEDLFRQEAMTAAILDHPNILPIHDLGRDPDGRPLLAMKLVQGVPWDRLIGGDFRALSPRAFLTRHIPILIATTQAVAFAHSRGILHRDLKPSQVMVGDYGEVLLMDWGLAACYDIELLRAVGHALRDDVAPTLERALNPSGTAAFMAPEQTLPHSRSLGPWTDIYLLGGTLYYLLTGQLPHAGADSAKVFYAASLGAFTPTREAAGDRWMPEELVALAERALEPLPENRPQHAEEFLLGIQDWLTGARREEDSRRLTGEVTSMLPEHGTSYRDYEQTLLKVSRARELWEQNPELPGLETRILTGYARQALSHGDLVLARVQASRLRETPERRGILLEAEARELKERRRTIVRRAALVSTITLLLLLTGGGLWFSHELRLERDAARDAQQHAERERDRAMEAREKSEGLASFMLRDLRTKLEPTGNLAALDGAAATILDYYLGLPFQELSPKEKTRAQAGITNAAILLAEMQGKKEEALRAYEAAIRLIRGEIDLRPDDTEWPYYLAFNLFYRGIALKGAGTFGQAEESFLESAAICERLIRDTPSYTIPGFVVNVYNQLVVLSLATQRMDDALEFSQKALEAAKTHGERSPDKQSGQFKVLQAREGLSRVYVNRGEPAQAAAVLEENRVELARLHEANPGHFVYFTHVVGNLRNLASAYGTLKRFDDAVALERERLELLNGALAKNPTNSNLQSYKVRTLTSLVKFQSLQGIEPDFALLDEGIAIIDAALGRDPSNTSWRFDKCNSYYARGNALTRLDRHEEARGQLLTARDLLHQVRANDPDGELHALDVLNLEASLARNTAALGDPEEAARQLDALLPKVREYYLAEPTSEDRLRAYREALESRIAIAREGAGEGLAALEEELASVPKIAGFE